MAEKIVAVRFSNGLAFSAKLPLLSKIKGPVSKLRKQAERIRQKNQKLSSSTALSDAEMENWARKQQQKVLYNYTMRLKDFFPKAYESLRKAHDLDAIVDRRFTANDFGECVDSLVDAFQALPEELRVEKSSAGDVEYDPEDFDDDTSLRRKGSVVVNCGFRYELTDNQIKLVDDIVAHEEEVLDALWKGIMNHYHDNSKLWALDLNVSVGQHPFLPKVTEPDDLNSIISLSRIFLAPSSDEVGFEIEVPWLDEEHGTIGIVLDNLTVVTTGDGSVADCA